MTTPAPNYYELLGVAPNATPAEITSAWRRVARRLHPDVTKTTTTAEQFIAAQRAYETLSDSALRKNYDRQNHIDATVAASPWQFQDTPPAPTWTSYTPPPKPTKAKKKPTGEYVFGARGNDLTTRVTIEFAEAVFGKEVVVFLARREVCRVCSGEPARSGCTICATSGSEMVEARVVVHIPPGTHSATQIVLPGLGDVGPRSGTAASPEGIPGPAGDLIVVVTVNHAAGVSISGNDLVYDVPVDVIDALLGLRRRIDLLDGPATIVVNPGTPYGTRIRISGRGVPTTHATRGDAFAEIRLVMRSNLSAAERRALEPLRATTQSPSAE